MPHLSLHIPSQNKTNAPSTTPAPRKDSIQQPSTTPEKAKDRSSPQHNARHVSPNNREIPDSQPPSPEPSSPALARPPISPITPKAVAAQLASMRPYDVDRDQIASQLPPPTYMARPKPVPISDSDNTDAIALRSAIALLQLQKEKSRQDIQTLERVRQSALEDPKGFVDALRAGRMAGAGVIEGGVLGPTLRTRRTDHDRDERDGDTITTITTATPAVAVVAADVKTEIPDSFDTGMEGELDAEEEETDEEPVESQQEPDDAKFPPLPTPQNIFRCPPINWAKYHISGEPLDRLHEEQLRKPSPGEPEYNGSSGSTRTQPYVLAAPYSPLTDQLSGAEHPMQTRRGSKKPA